MRFVIVTGCDRSGTTFLANLLDRAPNVEARHEFFGTSALLNPNQPGRTFSALSYYDPGHPYLERTLRHEKDQVLARFPDRHAFVDVNGRLRYALDVARRVLDEPACFQLVRNGRDVVRSFYLSKRYSERDKGSMAILPTDPATLELWQGYSRLERISWYWNHVVSQLLEQGIGVLHLERIVSDYQYLRERLLEPCGIALEPDVWRSIKDKRLHRTRFRPKFLLRGQPVSLKWTPELETRFMAIYGATMSALGYE